MNTQKMFGFIILVMAMELKHATPEWIQLPMVERGDKNIGFKSTTYANILHNTSEKKKVFESSISTLPSNEVDSTSRKPPTDKTDEVHRKTSSEGNFVQVNTKQDDSVSTAGKSTKEHNSNNLLSTSQSDLHKDKSTNGTLNANADQTKHPSGDKPAFNQSSSTSEENFSSNFIHKMNKENLTSSEKPAMPTMTVNWSGSIPPFDILRSVHQTLINEIPNSMKGKRKFLQKLQNKMLNYMEKRIKRLWTSDTVRQSRTDKGMSFPSLEGALMSICFLIFAVFLIKLVQQLIHKLQGANMSVTQQRLTPDLLTTARVLKLVDEFPYQYHKMDDQS